jgi:hypothetical protein
MRAFTVKERDLAAGLLPGEAMLEQIRKLRDSTLVEGEDFVKNGREVLYSVAGVEHLAELLRVEESPAKNGRDAGEGKDRDEAPAGNQALPQAQELMEGVLAVLPKKKVRVVKVFATNPQYLHGMTMDGKDGLLTVRVRSNKNFLPGMEVDVLRGMGGVWDYCGPLPRARGRW